MKNDNVAMTSLSFWTNSIGWPRAGGKHNTIFTVHMFRNCRFSRSECEWVWVVHPHVFLECGCVLSMNPPIYLCLFSSLTPMLVSNILVTSFVCFRFLYYIFFHLSIFIYFYFLNLFLILFIYLFISYIYKYKHFKHPASHPHSCPNFVKWWK